jgi:hypothetical protein
MEKEAVSFNVGGTYNLHKGHEYFRVVAITAQFVTMQRVQPAHWDESTIEYFSKSFRPFRRKIRHNFYLKGVDSVYFGAARTIFANAKVPSRALYEPRLVLLGEHD